MKLIVKFTLFFLINTAVWAQCGAGVTTGGGNCVPPDAPGMPGYQAEAAASPQVQRVTWIDQWGAIVIDNDTGGAGTVTNRLTKSDAIRDATRDCSSHGAVGCKVALTYVNQCAAVAWGEKMWGVAGAADQETAQKLAIKSCGQYGAGCKIVYSACSEARSAR
jgi:Domain of unknown function (DUF4189)